MPVTVRYFAAAKAAVGVDQEQIASPGLLSELVEYLAAKHGKRLAQVLSSSSYLVHGVRAGLDEQVPDGSVVDVLPPFAGG